MRQYENSNQSSLVLEPAIAYGKRQMFENLIQFDGLTSLELSGDTLDDVVNLTNLTVIELSEILEMSKPNYYRKRQEPRLDLKTIDKLAALLKIYDQGLDTFGSLLDFDRWLSQENFHLGNRPPRQFLKTERGRARLHQAIGRIEHGIYG